MDFSGVNDVNPEGDHIDLSSYNSVSSGPLHFDGTNPHTFDHTAGSVRTTFTVNDDTLVQVDINGNGHFDAATDFSVLVKGHHELTANDFYL